MSEHSLIPAPTRQLGNQLEHPRFDIESDPGMGSEDTGPQWRTHWKLIIKRKWLILQLVVIVVCLTAIGVAKLRPTYEATAVIQIDREDREFFRTSGVVINALNDEDYFRTQLQLLKSPTLARSVVKGLDLEHNPDLFPKGAASLTELGFQLLSRRPQLTKPTPAPMPTPSATLEVTPSQNPDTGSVDQNEIKRLSPFANFLLGGLDIYQVPQTRLVQIRYQHHNPELAAKIVNTFCDIFSADNLSRRKNTSNTTADFLQKQIASLQSEIRKSEEKLVNYSKTNQISLEPNQNTLVDRLVNLNKQLLEAEADRKNIEAVYQISKQAEVESLPEILSDPNIRKLNDRILELNQKRADLIAQFTPEWPEVKSLDEQIRQLEAALKTEKQRTISSIALKYQAALSKERALRSDFQNARGETQQQNKDAISYRMIQQEIDNNKNLLNQLLQRAKEVNVSAAAEANNINVTDYAPTPEMPIAPRPLSTLMLSFFCSLFGGIGLAYILEYFDTSIRSVDDIDSFVRLPTLGIIPSASSLETKGRRLLQLPSSKKKLSSNQLSTLVSEAGNSSISETYRQLRTSLLLSTAHTPPKCILVSSSVPSEGKTTTAVNTAISLAQTGARVIIIDCDMRRPSVHVALGCPSDVGLSNYLTSDRDLGKLIQHGVKVKTLSVLPCGPTPPNPAELLGSTSMVELLDYCRNKYDHVIVDSPPVLSFADAIILSRLVDGVMLVIHGGKSDRESVLMARRYFADANARLLGVVLNNIEFTRSEYGYYRSYYNHYNEKR